MTAGRGSAPRSPPAGRRAAARGRAGAVLLGLLVAASLLGGTALFLLGSFYRAGAGTSQPGTLAITLGTIGILLPLLFINAPEPAAPRPRPGRDGKRRARAAGGALCFPRADLAGVGADGVGGGTAAQPLSPAQGRDRGRVCLRPGRHPDRAAGNVLMLPNGSVGVEEACSGIRSLTGCLFAGSFLAAVFLERLWKKIALVVAAMLLAFLTNLARSLFLTTWAYRYGPHAIDGRVHDLAGYAVLGLTVAGLLGLLPLLNLKFGGGAGRRSNRRG